MTRPRWFDFVYANREKFNRIFHCLEFNVSGDKQKVWDASINKEIPMTDHVFLGRIKLTNLKPYVEAMNKGGK